MIVSYSSIPYSTAIFYMFFFLMKMTLNLIKYDV